MSVLEATYAMDDLHRIEVILATQKPSSASYALARSETTKVLREVQVPVSRVCIGTECVGGPLRLAVAAAERRPTLL